MELWSASERDAFVEATRTVPGMLAAYANDDRRGAMLLVDAYHEHAAALGLAHCTAWAVMFSAALHWARETSLAMAELRGVEHGEVLREMATMAAEWQVTR